MQKYLYTTYARLPTRIHSIEKRWLIYPRMRDTSYTKA